MREWMARTAARLAPRVLPPLGVGVVLGLLGPFGTFAALAPGPRLGYWLAVVSLNWMLADALIRRVEALVGARLPAPRVLVPLLGALAAAVPATGVVALANATVGLGWPGSLTLLFGQVLLLLAAIALPAYTLMDLQEQLAAAPANGPGPAGSEAAGSEAAGSGPAGSEAAGGLALFVARLPGPLEGRLVCLEMQDHYLRVHSTAGAAMILCRMEDAARELGGLGRRVHRSWWVAEDAVAGVERDGQRLFLRLSDDRRVPVGRSYRAGLKAAGWL